MNWDKSILNKIEFDNISNIEEKKKLGEIIANKVEDGQVIGFGSGSTSYIATTMIAERVKQEKLNIVAIPTSYEIRMLCTYLGIKTANLTEYKPDWSFDGADEVDSNSWLIKGRGGASFKEKLNIVNSPITYILVDKTKRVTKLGERFKIPVECVFESINFVKEELIKLGGTNIKLRKAGGKDGPVITENSNVILDVKFENIDKDLEKKIKCIPGVIESGLFIGYNVKILEF